MRSASIELFRKLFLRQSSCMFFQRVTRPALFFKRVILHSFLERVSTRSVSIELCCKLFLRQSSCMCFQRVRAKRVTPFFKESRCTLFRRSAKLFFAKSVIVLCFDGVVLQNFSQTDRSHVSSKIFFVRVVLHSFSKESYSALFFQRV